MKKIIIMLFATLMLAGCTLFQKTSGSDELENMTQQVLKKGEGVEIDVKPIPIQKVK